jgi:hypothetical protein
LNEDIADVLDSIKDHGLLLLSRLSRSTDKLIKMLAFHREEGRSSLIDLEFLLQNFQALEGWIREGKCGLLGLFLQAY